jgi:phospholipase/lecithinase/hemolysin
MNFAIATARARVADPHPSLAMEVAAFLAKTGGVAPADALYIMEFGANDIGDALAAPSPAAALAILTNAVAGIVDAITTLRNAGARTFLVTNVPSAGLTPAARILEVLQPGTVAAATAATTAFNGLLAGALAPLPLTLGITIVPFDGDAMFKALVANPSAAGLENVTDACVTPDTAPFVCHAPDRYLYWDGIHPTAAVHALVARAVAQLLGI